MKKFVLTLVTLALLSTLAVAAPSDDGKQMKLFADLGLAFSDYEGLFAGVGFQYGFTSKLFAEAAFTYYFNPDGTALDFSSWIIDLDGVYKHELSEKLNLFGKAGLSLIHTSVDLGWLGSGSESDIGFNLGGGVEYALTEKMDLRGGASVVFGDGMTFFKVYGGVAIGL